jgi:hypothetical protein
LRVIILVVIVATVIIGCSEQKKTYTEEKKVKEIDLSGFCDSKPEKKKRLLFIHHSCGGQWLADIGEDVPIIPDTCIYKSHPNGGGLRALLGRNNYEVHEAAYKSAIGARTDVCDWNSKFRDMMEDILICDRQDDRYRDHSEKNEIVMFKSCFPNSEIVSEGKGEGDPDSCEKTVTNFKAAYRRLLEYFKTRPDTLFVVVTAPPVINKIPSRTKEFIKRMIGSEETVEAMGKRARRFNNWLKDGESGWLAGYQGKNVVVFDYYDVLTGHGKSDHLIYPTGGGADSHPNAAGNSIASREFVSFLNRSFQRYNEYR